MSAAAAAVAAALGNQRVRDLEAENAALWGELDKAFQETRGKVAIIEGLNASVGLLKMRFDDANRNAMVVIASLLTLNGGRATVTHDVIAAVNVGGHYVDFDRDGAGVTLTLVDPEDGDAGGGALDAEERDELDPDDDFDDDLDDDAPPAKGRPACCDDPACNACD